ncbi:hypothetical protein [Streptomyces sp. NPDC056061]|uniref:hypothetical protein n=1 Tax=Streptomyces sp. NPDC056061 TaxID=3345700 RepID=UPI0035E379AD
MNTSKLAYATGIIAFIFVALICLPSFLATTGKTAPATAGNPLPEEIGRSITL